MLTKWEMNAILIVRNEYIENYAMLGERYVVKCDSSLGKIGDILRFTQNDGTVVECVIGATTVGAASKNLSA